MAYFKNDGDIHYFTYFDGDRTSVLYKFYRGAYKVMTGYYKDLLVSDQFPVNTFNNKFLSVIQDFFAPFIIFITTDYQLRYLSMGDDLMQTNIRLQSTIISKFGNRNLKTLTSNFTVGQHGLESFQFEENGRNTKVNFEVIQ